MIGIRTPIMVSTASICAILLLPDNGMAAEQAQDKKPALFEQYFPQTSDYITPLLDVRYRYEYVDQAGKKDANASTLRTRFGFETKAYHGLSFLIEGENVGVIGNEEYYSTVNGKSTYAKVPDPDVTELNRLQLSYSGLADTDITIGRQYMNMGSRHFIGTPDWRQNITSFDALSVENTALSDTKIVYAYITKQHNNLGYDAGGNVDTDTHAIDFRYSGLTYSKITPYLYLMDDNDVAALSNMTWGIYVYGENKVHDSVYFLHNLEYAHQSDYQDNPNEFDLNYYHLKFGLKWQGLTVRLGWDTAEGNGTTGLITQFAANHEFRGWEDKFSVIPSDGLEDKYIELSYKVKETNTYADGVKFMMQYHDFDAENTNADYGTEWDFKLAKNITEHVEASLYFESYSADSFSKDTDKVIFQLGFAL